MSTIEWFQTMTVLASLMSAALAWLAKLRWSREYAAAKDETIRAKEAQIASKQEQLAAQCALNDVLKREIETLRELTPMKIQEYFQSVKKQLEDYNDGLKKELNRQPTELQKKDRQLQDLLAGSDPNAQASLKHLQESRRELQTKVVALEAQTRHQEATLQNLDEDQEELMPHAKLHAMTIAKAVGISMATVLFPSLGIPLLAATWTASKLKDDSTQNDENDANKHDSVDA